MSLYLCFAMNEYELKHVHVKLAKPADNSHSVPAVEAPPMTQCLPFPLWISGRALSSREPEIPEGPMRPGVSHYRCCLNASFNYPQAALLSNDCQNLPRCVPLPPPAQFSP